MSNEEIRVMLKLFARQRNSPCKLNGKGSRRRPTFVPMHEFGENWAKIFEKPKQKEEENVNSRDTELERGTEEGQPTTETNGRDAL
jgi:hypothetical protein